MTRRRLLSPRRWTPPKAPPNGGRTPATTDLEIVRRVPTGGHGPEDVVFDGEGNLLTGLADGRVVRVDARTGHRTVLATTGGRPLGLDPSGDGSVLVCDHDRGLLRIAPDGGVEVLTGQVDGERLTFASNVARTRDGLIFFTTSTQRWDLDHYLGDVFEHSCTGRLLRHDPSGETTVLLEGLKFANGLVLAPDGSHLLYAETQGYRIGRYWLTGPRADTAEPFVDNLPGHPDNMSVGSDGLVWVAMPAPRNALLDALLPLPGFLRTVVYNLPVRLRPRPVPIAWVMAFSFEGELVHDLRSTDSNYGFVTAVAERDGVLALGSLHEDDIAIARTPERA